MNMAETSSKFGDHSPRIIAKQQTAPARPARSKVEEEAVEVGPQEPGRSSGEAYHKPLFRYGSGPYCYTCYWLYHSIDISDVHVNGERKLGVHLNSMRKFGSSQIGSDDFCFHKL